MDILIRCMKCGYIAGEDQFDTIEKAPDEKYPECPECGGIEFEDYEEEVD